MIYYGGMVQEKFVRKYRANFRRRQERLAAITGKEAALEYVASLREKLKRTFSFPENCPLNPVVTGSFAGPGYRMEKIIIESRPAFPVTMNFYLPEKVSGKIPAVLELCGHAGEGKASTTYQSYAVGLVRRGCAVLLVDPIEQGERHQVAPDDKNPGLCEVHNRLGRLLKSLGDSFGAWRIYDAKRALDYLLTRPEIDPARVGVSGNSGGGTLTTLVNACDDRFAAAAPSCYITRFYRNVENELPVDAEQIPPAFAADGGDMADLLIAAAPRPVIIMGQKNDFFDIRGTREVYEEVRHFYTLLGCPERVHFFCGPQGHGLSIHNRNAAHEFWVKTLGIEPGGEPEDIALPPEKETYCTVTGSTLPFPQYKTLWSILNDMADAAVKNRPQLGKEELQERLATMLGIGKIEVPYYRQLRPEFAPGRSVVSRFGIESAPDTLVTMKFFGPEHFHIPSGDEAELYLPHQDSLAELGPQAKELGSGPILHFALDYQGVGESMPRTCDHFNEDFFGDYLYDYHYDSISWLSGESWTGDRVRDTLSAIELLTASGVKHITLTAQGIGQIVAIFAAILSKRNVSLKLSGEKLTYLNNVRRKAVLIPQSMTPAGILNLTDLDELYNLAVKR